MIEHNVNSHWYCSSLLRHVSIDLHRWWWNLISTLIFQKKKKKHTIASVFSFENLHTYFDFLFIQTFNPLYTQSKQRFKIKIRFNDPCMSNTSLRLQCDALALCPLHIAQVCDGLISCSIRNVYRPRYVDLAECPFLLDSCLHCGVWPLKREIDKENEENFDGNCGKMVKWKEFSGVEHVSDMCTRFHGQKNLENLFFARKFIWKILRKSKIQLKIQDFPVFPNTDSNST